MVVEEDSQLVMKREAPSLPEIEDGPLREALSESSVTRVLMGRGSASGISLGDGTVGGGSARDLSMEESCIGSPAALTPTRPKSSVRFSEADVMPALRDSLTHIYQGEAANRQTFEELSRLPSIEKPPSRMRVRTGACNAERDSAESIAERDSFACLPAVNQHVQPRDRRKVSVMAPLSPRSRSAARMARSRSFGSSCG